VITVTGHYSSRFAPPGLSAPPPAGTTIPTTTYAVTASQDGHLYDFTIVGGNFTSASTGVTTVPFHIEPLTVTFTPTGDVYDPTSANAGCSEPVSPLTAVETGPELAARNWYAGRTFLGRGQYANAQLRGEFYAYDGPHAVDPGYGLNLASTNNQDLSLSINASEANAGTCDELGEIDYGTFDGLVQSFLNSHPDNTSVPLIVLKNIVLTSNGCCIGGYHNAFTNSAGNTQVYAVTSYLTPDDVSAYGIGAFNNLAIISHEVSELVNDPFVNNATPAWGHLGQQPNCQGNLEVGDPLTGTLISIAPPTVGGGGLTYNLQEEVYAGWFYGANWGANGWYSSNGTFTSPSALCT
jgi:hypothetical protein